MGVAPGSPVTASNTNAHFIDSDSDDTGIGIYTLANTNPVSGVPTTNLQRDVNGLNSYTGRPTNDPYNSLPVWTDTNAGTPTDSLAGRGEALTAKMNPSTGHTHDGTAGQGPQVSAGNIASTRLHGFFVQGVDLSASVSGTSTTVTTEMSGKIPSSGTTVKGVVVTTVYNRVVIRNFSDDEILDGSGNEVYGRITESAGTWTLSYYSLVSGTETAYSFSASSDVRWYFQELFNPIVDAPVYSELATVPSENTTSDVLSATESTEGKTLLSNVAPPAIASTGAKGGTGSPLRVSYSDHTHEGVHQIGAYGVAGTPIKGDTNLEAGTNITLSYNSGRIKIDGGGTVSFQEVPAGVVNGSNTTFGPLTYTPSSDDSIAVFLDGLIQNRSTWSVSGNSIVFATAPALDQDVYVFYTTGGTPAVPPTPTGTLQTEFRTITSGEAAAKQLTLSFTPATPGEVLVDIIGGGGAQEFNVDYTISGAVLNWNGYALDGVLAQSDRLRINYIT
jgi:hypothetical protein